MEPSALVLLLGLVLLVAKQGLAVAARTQSSSASHPSSAAEKPGRCPLGWGQGVPAARAFCFSDASCPGSEKCCRIGTLRICAQPAMVSPGYCPKPCVATEEPCLVSCLDDSWCGPGEKCCHRDCHSRCLVAEPARPGVCPRRRALWGGPPCTDQCEDDRSCPEGLKCCFGGCGLECVSPRTEELRPCTEASHPPAQAQCSDQCVEDADCPRAQRCSPTHCGLKCKGPPAGKPGVCPLQGLRGSLGPCLGPALRNCSDDFDCEAAKKCCVTGCSQVCKEPEEVRPGACPPRAAERGALECGPTFCVRDQDCPKPHEKCCRLPCGWVCTAPVASGAAGIPAAEMLQREIESPGDPEKASGTLLSRFREDKAHE